MAGAFLEFTLNDDPVMQGLARLEAGVEDAQPLLRQIGAYGVRSTQERFLSETAPDGARWAPLNPAYAELKGGGYNILFKSGALMNSMNSRAGLNEVSWGSPMIYAAVHQFGATIKPKNAPALEFLLGNIGSRGLVPVFLVRVKSVTIPARPYLGINAADREEIVALTGDYIRELL